MRDAEFASKKSLPALKTLNDVISRLPIRGQVYPSVAYKEITKSSISLWQQKLTVTVLSSGRSRAEIV